MNEIGENLKDPLASEAMHPKKVLVLTSTIALAITGIVLAGNLWSENVEGTKKTLFVFLACAFGVFIGTRGMRH